MELDPVEHLTTDAIGPPGERVFYLQARSDGDVVTILVEKQQVQLLAASILEILARVGLETGTGTGEEEMDLVEPVEPRWRAGRLSIGYHEERDLLVLDIEELVPGADEEDDEDEEDAEPDPDRVPEREPERVRLWATREQMLALSRHATQVAARGRPTCRFCGNPIDTDGHVCPAMNGHGRMGGD